MPPHPSTGTELPELLVADAAEWRRWLEVEHANSTGVWLVLGKVGGAVTELMYGAALDEALCFGWIDGQLRKRDAGSYQQRFTPRRAKSAWSARNITHTERLLEAGLIEPAGLAAIAAAKADGRWERAYAPQSNAELPADLLAAIAEVPAAQQTFDQLTATNRYALYYRTNEAKRPATRARRIATFVEMLAAGQAVHPQKNLPKR